MQWRQAPKRMKSKSKSPPSFTPALENPKITFFAASLRKLISDFIGHSFLLKKKYLGQTINLLQRGTSGVGDYCDLVRADKKRTKWVFSYILGLPKLQLKLRIIDLFLFRLWRKIAGLVPGTDIPITKIQNNVLISWPAS